MISPRSNLASVSAPSAGTNAVASVPGPLRSGSTHEHTRPKLLRRELSGVFVQLQQRITDTELAAATGIPRPHVNRWRSGQAMPNVVHVASMPDDAFLFVVRGVLNARVTYGKRAYRIVEVDGDDRGVEREARVAQLEATCKQLTAAVAQLTELVQQMQVGK